MGWSFIDLGSNAKLENVVLPPDAVLRITDGANKVNIKNVTTTGVNDDNLRITYEGRHSGVKVNGKAVEAWPPVNK